MLDNSHKKGGTFHRSLWLRNLNFWRHFRDYFPVTLNKEVDLDPTKNYIFGYHPHGIISVGALTNFVTDVNNFNELFPGIKLHLLTLATNFRIPFFRDYLLCMGLCSVAADSCNYILNSGNGNSIMIVIGGAAESLDARPGVHDLTLASRKGFVKVALRNGASLVPTFCFGENELFDQIENEKGSKLRHFQNWLQKKMGFAIPLFSGRGVFNYHYGILPKRKPLRTIVGVPIDCPKTSEPTDAQIDEYHSKYLNGLREIWDRYKNELARDRRSSLQFVDAPISNKSKKNE